MAKRKCYFCKDRFDEDYTARTRHKTGGAYNRAAGYRPVRACYRCIAAQAYKHEFQMASGNTREKMAEWGWVIPADYYDHGYGWDAFKVLWPYDQWGPTDPATIPEKLLPPQQGVGDPETRKEK